MKRGPQMALAVAGGYVLGRSKKMKLALMLGGLAAGRQIGSSPAELLAEGSKLVGSSPELGKLVDQLRSGLVEAGKGAATAAAARQVDALSDRLRAQSDALTGTPAVGRGSDSSDTSDSSDSSDTSGGSKTSEAADTGAAPGKAARRPARGSATANTSRAAARTSGSASRSSAGSSRSTGSASRSGTAPSRSSGTASKSTGNARSTASGARTRASGSRGQSGRAQGADRGSRRGEADG